MKILSIAGYDVVVSSPANHDVIACASCDGICAADAVVRRFDHINVAGVTVVNHIIDKAIVTQDDIVANANIDQIDNSAINRIDAVIIITTNDNIIAT